MVLPLRPASALEGADDASRDAGNAGLAAVVAEGELVEVRAKTDRLDTEQLRRALLGWLRGERDYCKMAAIPTFAEEDAKRPSRERESLVGEQGLIPPWPIASGPRVQKPPVVRTAG